MKRLALAALLVAASFAAIFALWIATVPLGPDGSAIAYSTQVEARDGRLLRSFQTDDDRWRLPLSAKDVDPLYLAMLKAYEDKHFDTHSGVDITALMRASLQMLTHGRIVSGGSTLSMQVARLLSPNVQGRSFEKKFTEIARAWRLQHRLGRERMLDIYLSLAPFGGNIEGVRQASLFYFGKEPKRLSVGEAALLVALPQSPETRRPDRHSETARKARDRVLARMLTSGVIREEAYAAALTEEVPQARRPALALAFHEADEARRQTPKMQRIRLTIDRALQDNLEALLIERLRNFAPQITIALIVIDHKSGNVLARIGNAAPFSSERLGAVDISRAVRSPGSTLKPFIYALGFESGFLHPETLMEDRPTRFGTWAPSNFDMTFQGTVAAKTALQLSLNVPAVAVLEQVGPQRLLARFSDLGAETILPNAEAAGLAIALGGIGIRPIDLARLYASLANGGKKIDLRERMDQFADEKPFRSFSAASAWQVADILQNTPAPDGAITGRYAYKTGTSYGYRDAWAVGFDGAHTVLVWVGRADGVSSPGLTGRTAAAPLLFEIFARVGAHVNLPPPPADVLLANHTQLPQPLKRFGQKAGDGVKPTHQLRIAMPIDGTRIDLGHSRNAPESLMVKLQGGQPPYNILINDQQVIAAKSEKIVEISGLGAGFHTVTVIDKNGQSATASVRIE